MYNEIPNGINMTNNLHYKENVIFNNNERENIEENKFTGRYD